MKLAKNIKIHKEKVTDFQSDNQSDNFSDQSDNQSDNFRGRLGDIYRNICTYGTAKKVIEKTGMKKGNVSRGIKNLIKKGYIKEIDRGVYENAKVITLGGLSPSLNKGYGSKVITSRYRFHRFKAQILIHSDIIGDFKKLLISNGVLPQLHDKSLRFDINEYTGELSNLGALSMIITDDRFYSGSLAARKAIHDDVLKGIMLWQTKFKFDFLRYNKLRYHISQLEIADTDDSLGEHLQTHNINGMIVRDDIDGKARYIIDTSKGIPEFEFVHSKHNFSDLESWEKLCGYLQDGSVQKAIENYPDLKNLMTVMLSSQAVQANHLAKVTELLSSIFSPLSNNNGNNNMGEEYNKDKPFYVG